MMPFVMLTFFLLCVVLRVALAFGIVTRFTNTELVEVSLFYGEAKTMSVAVEMQCLSRVTITEIVLTITKFSNQQRSHSSVPRLIPNDRIATSSPL